MAELGSHLYGNPHSHHPSSLLTTAAIAHTRETVLEFFGTDADHYDVVFTSGCTGALKLLSECFPWTSGEGDAGLSKVTSDEIRRDGIRSKNKHESELFRETQNGLHDEEDIPLPYPAVRTSVLFSQQLRNSENSAAASSLFTSSTGSIFCYLEDNHTSVVGMREVAAQFGAMIVCATEDDIVSLSQACSGASQMKCQSHEAKSGTPKDAQLIKKQQDSKIDTHSSNGKCHNNFEPYHLFVYPAQSNFSGRKYPLSWTQNFPLANVSSKPNSTQNPSSQGVWMVCLDAASFVATNPLDLSKHPAHFVTLSFYKMFGYPTGLGALLVRKDCSHLLEKRYFGGGTVLATVSRAGIHVPRPALHDRSAKVTSYSLNNTLLETILFATLLLRCQCIQCHVYGNSLIWSPKGNVHVLVLLMGQSNISNIRGSIRTNVQNYALLQ